MKTMNNAAKRVSLAAILATAVVGMAIATPSKANEIQNELLTQHTVQLNEQAVQNELQYELKLEKQLTQQVANAESRYVAQICQQHDLPYDNETSTCRR
ncbi:hypothetical protein [Shewanella subflava]|uniref:Uncharacterized protein n=1 Tax=Shewanella subflava TaxID=2986476 RepID=A0ABT3I5I1_9GAMM|nr:hypothetical protein [Shewanella subflava]MCW3171330.1 hypothetical protein [Shewanella subflava]